MKPNGETTYRLSTDTDRPALWELGVEETAFPTVVAERGGEIIGCLATQEESSAVVAGPLVVKDGRLKAIAAIRLAEAYENVLRLVGVNGYYFCIDIEHEGWVKSAMRMGTFKLHSDEGHQLVFWREIA
jgi:hypothetical protein